MTVFLFRNGESRVLTQCPDCAVRWSSSLEADGPAFEPCPQCDPLAFLRRVLNYIHASGSIWYDAHNKAVYSIVARVASDMRHHGSPQVTAVTAVRHESVTNGS